MYFVVVVVWLFNICIGTDFVHLTYERVCMYEKNFENMHNLHVTV